MRSDTPLILIPFSPAFLRPPTREIVGARFVDVSSDDQAYWRLLRDLWTDRQSFILIEHDVAPTKEQIDSLWNCPEEWCAYPYSMGDIETTALGCVKFEDSLIERTSDLLSGIIERLRDWRSLDVMVVGELHRRRASEHVHLPAVRHLHDYTPPPPRRPVLTKLRYIGNGSRYLNGVPAENFETWDDALVATCLESGLYMVEAPRKVRESRFEVSKYTPPTSPGIVESVPEPTTTKE